MKKAGVFLALLVLTASGYLLFVPSDTEEELAETATISPADTAKASGVASSTAANASLDIGTTERREDGRAIDEEANPDSTVENVITENGLSQSVALELLSGDGYDDMVIALQQEVVTPEQSMRNQRYQEHLIQRPEFQNGDLVMEQIQCGKSLCTLAVTINDENVWQDYFNNVVSSDDYPTYVMVDYPSQRRGQATQRMLFSVDPEINSLHFSAD